MCSVTRQSRRFFIEMKNQKIYLTTGEFAKLCHTTKHTLFHYCDINIFSPAYTDENGYRYYHVLQYDTFMTILELRAIGMSLTEIKKYLAERSPESMIELYDKQEQLINKQITRLKKIKTHVCRQKETINQVINCLHDYFVETQKQCYLSCSEWMIQRGDYAMTTSIGTLMMGNHLDDNTLNNSGMVCKLHDAILSENYPFCFYMSTTSRQPTTTHIKQAGSYLCTYHYGNYDALRHSFQKLTIYANQQHIELDDWIYTETIIGNWAVRQPQEYIIKISIKVKNYYPSDV